MGYLDFRISTLFSEFFFICLISIWFGFAETYKQ